MRLRNKKTGNIYTLSDDLYIAYTQGGKIELRAIIPGGNMSYYYDSLDKLYHEWEDYKPVEPLIKDEKIRKAVRAWAEANGVDRVILGQVNNDELVKKSPTTDFGCHISFEGSLGLERGRNYTIEELCGGEEK